MIKAKEFWDVVCNEFEYRFFSGVVCNEFDRLYKSMSSDFMHYIPAVNEQIGLSLVNGVKLSGMNSALLIGLSNINRLDFSFNLDSNIPLLIIGGGKVDNFYFSNYFTIVKPTKNFIKSFEKVNDILNKGESCILQISKGDIV